MTPLCNAEGPADDGHWHWCDLPVAHRGWHHCTGDPRRPEPHRPISHRWRKTKRRGDGFWSDLGRLLAFRPVKR